MDVDSNSYQSARMHPRMPNKLIIKYAWISICFSTVVIFAAILLQIMVLVNIFPLMEFCLILLFAAVLLYLCTAFITLLIISKVKPERQHNQSYNETFGEYENNHCTQRMIEQIPPLSTSQLDSYQPSTLIPTPPPPYVESTCERRTCRSRDKVVRRQRSKLKQVHRRPNNEQRRDLRDQVQILNRQVSSRNSCNSAGIEMTTINTSQNMRKICRISSKAEELSEEITVSSESETKPRSTLRQISSRCRARKKGINASSESERGRMITLHQKSPGSNEDINGSSLFEKKFAKSTCRNSHRYLAKKDDVSASSKSERRLLPSVISRPKQKDSNYANVNDVFGISPTNLNTIPYKCQELDSREMDNKEEERNRMPSAGDMKVSAFTGSERLGVIDEVQQHPLAQSRILKAGSARLNDSSSARKEHVDIKSPNRASLLSKSPRMYRSDTSRLFSNRQSSHTTANRISSPSKLPSALNSKTYNMSPNKQITYNGVIVPTKLPSVDHSQESMMSPNKKGACLAPREISFSESTPMASVSNKSRFSPNPEIPNSAGILEQGHVSSSKDFMRQDKTMACGQSGCTQTQVNSKAKDQHSLRSKSDISKKIEAVGQITQKICILQDPENLSHMARPDPADRLVAFNLGVFSNTNNALWNEAPTNKVTDLL